MKRLFRHMKNPEVRGSTESALKTSAALPSSDFTFVNNSQGASAAVAELSKYFDTAFEQIELEGDLKEQLQIPLQRLDNEASKYCNSQLSEEDKKAEWICTVEEAQLIGIAWECAAGTYEPANRIHHDQYNFRQDRVISPSTGGSRKTMTLTTVTQQDREQSKTPLLPLVVIGIRGSHSKVDHMVNANNQPKSAGSFINVQGLGLESSELEAHSGFLSSAEVLDAAISKHFEELGLAKMHHVLFTGHSAGGAVASLLCLRYLSRRNIEYRSLQFSCITFGSPPVIRPSILSRRPPIPGEGLVLNIINEFDLVTRADGPYVLSLVNLYRSIYQMLPVPEAKSPDSGVEQNSNSSTALRFSSDGDSTRNIWAVPSAFYGHFGERVVLHMQMCEKSSRSEDDDDSADMLKLKAFKVATRVFQELLFCRISVHSRAEYQKRVDLIASGYFNNLDGWKM